MNCKFQFVERDGVKFVHQCSQCGIEVRSKSQTPNLKATCKQSPPSGTAPAPPPPPWGVGSALKEIFAELGVKPKPGCGCENKIKLLDAKGLPWAKEHRAEIVAMLKESYQEM